MKIRFLVNVLFVGIFSLFLFTAMDSPKQVKKINCTELNGDGCVCHTVIRTPEVAVWVTGPDTLRAGQSGIYKMYLANGPAIAGGYNIATRFGTLEIMDTISVLLDNEITQRIPLVFPTIHDTIHWYFKYTAPMDKTEDTLYSCGISVNYDGEPTELDQWNYGPKFKVTIISGALPVELSSFESTIQGDLRIFKWTTASETNNKAFILQRQTAGKWIDVQSVQGGGNSVKPLTYTISYPVKYEQAKTEFRLLQIDFNGQQHILKNIEVQKPELNSYIIDFTNYPNPFNPSTTFSVTLPQQASVRLLVYAIDGRVVSEQNLGNLQQGNHSIPFTGGDLASGLYFARIQAVAGNVTELRTIKIVLTK